MFSLHQAVKVSYTTKDFSGSAVQGKDYIAKTGVVEFVAGSRFAHFEIEICDDDDWLPIRKFEVELTGILEGSAVLGQARGTVCTCVDDDIYPRKVVRDPQKYPLQHDEVLIRS